MNLDEMKALPPERQKELFLKLDQVRAAGKATNYACLTMDTDVLTPSGYKKFSELSAGDEVIALNTETGSLVKDKIEHLHFYEDAEVVHYGDSKTTFKCTENHRWFGFYNRTPDNGETHKEWKFETVVSAKKTFNFLLSAHYNGGDLKVSTEQAELIGWLLADGFYKWSAVNEDKVHLELGVKGSIAQLKFQSELEQCLLQNGFEIRQHTNNSGVPVYTLGQKKLREFLDLVVGSREDKHDVDWVNWVLNLSSAARGSFIKSFWLSDGLQKSKGGVVISQNRGNICDAVQLALFLDGKRSTISADEKCVDIYQHLNAHTTNQRKTVKARSVEDVFCLTTTTGTFVCRQNEETFITGNCQYSAGVATIARTAKVNDKIAKKLHKGYWELNWTIEKIASLMKVKSTSFGTWQQNPINKMWYSLRTDKDRFSTLVQGSGAYVLDVWLFHVKRLAAKRNLDFKLLGQFHKLIVA